MRLSVILSLLLQLHFKPVARIMVSLHALVTLCDSHIGVQWLKSAGFLGSVSTFDSVLNYTAALQIATL